jgi:cellulose synthase/poly-beta-1,6-N-acetylglucosamine synthase-like glycosyltransferase
MKKLSNKKSLNINHSFFPKVAVIMSAYQEEFIIREKLKSLKEQNYPKDLLTFWIASDGSMDETNQIIQDECINLSNSHVFIFNNRRGKPTVINDLVSKAKAFYNDNDFIIVLTDANVIFKNDLVSFLVQPFFLPDISLVDAKIEPLNKVSKGISISESFYLNKETFLKQNEGIWKGLSMGASGGCYAIRSNDFVPVPKDFLVDDFFISFNILLKGKKAILNTLAICYEEVSSSICTEFRRRRRISAGNFQNLFYFFPLFSMNQLPLLFVFFSHKVIRWFVPLFLILSFFFLCYLTFYQVIIYNTIITLSLFLVAVFIFDKFFENINIHLPFLRGVRYFIVINAALLLGCFDFLKGIKNNVWEPTKRNQ